MTHTMQTFIRDKKHAHQTHCAWKRPLWHRSCYSEATNKLHLQKARYRKSYALSSGTFAAKKRGLKRTIGDIDNESLSEPFVPFTRSGTVTLDKDQCFVCQLSNDEKLRTENADRTLREAVETSNQWPIQGGRGARAPPFGKA